MGTGPIFVEEIPIRHVEWDDRLELGEGAFGVVESGTLRRTQRVAMKSVFLSRLDDPPEEPGIDEIVNFQREVETYSYMDHINVLKIIGVVQHQGNPEARDVTLHDPRTCIVVDLLTATRSAPAFDRPLPRYPQRLPSHPLPCPRHPQRPNNGSVGPSRWYGNAFLFARGIRYIHLRGFVHRDIKPDNALIREADGLLKIADFGMAERIQNGRVNPPDPSGGTLNYMAPEIWRRRILTPKVDIWAFGCCLIKIFGGGIPWGEFLNWEGWDRHGVIDAVTLQRRHPWVPAGWPQVVRNIVLDCLEYRPHRRPSAAEVLYRLEHLTVADVPP
ncbi:unnamed protein product [Vitrella brassicaformis CCMP3155]|uniref:Protein kinase domain-containing protein n=1 Tax=Vitrella brassicaformis (strain CCMP3155) TaxID=1169540 RepID=A0A0G4EQT7_VITBC|nr:unnamed protein product [Vitrella brassicaformis CCMP3155]|eukprot:CEM00598.1 unnamed protein product [Vitrella brassicaformis CCMP3155]